MKNSFAAKPIKIFIMVFSVLLYSSTSEAFCLFNCPPKKTREQCEQENSDLRSQYMNEYAQQGMLNGSDGTTTGLLVGTGVGAAAGWVKGWWKGEDCSKYPSAQ